MPSDAQVLNLPPDCCRLMPGRCRGRRPIATGALLVTIVLLVSGGAFVQGRPAAATAPNLYVGHFARLTTDLPEGWRVDPSGIFDYAGPDGFLSSEPVAGASLDEACATFAASLDEEAPPSVTAATWSGQAACQVAGQYRGVEVLSRVIPHGRPFSLWGTDYAYAAVTSDPGHLDAIAGAIDFSPDRITPEVYAASLLDLAEARSFWSDQVDWPVVRRQVLEFVDGLETVEMARQGILNIIIQNIRMMGDNNSSISLPDVQAERLGFGALLASGHVIVVYPDSPAERAGIRVGDDIEAIGGQPIRFFVRLVEAAATRRDIPTTSDGSTTVTLRRMGAPIPIEVTIEPGSFALDALPTGDRLAGDVGLLTLSGAINGEQESAYVAAAHRVLAEVDSAPTCGWIVDLRFATVRSYPEIIASIGPLLGNGVFGGWRGRAGGQTWAAYDDGVITEDGFSVPVLAQGSPPALQQPDAPIAVLTGRMTAGAGEVATLALLGRPETRLFGEPTGEATTFTRRYPLFDGSALFLAEASLTDRTGAEYPDGIQPDVEIETNWTAYATEADEVLTAAHAWLLQHPACAA